MAVAFQAKGTALDTVTVTLALVAPTTAADDILIANISSLNNVAVVPPIGWTIIQQNNNTAAMSQCVAWKRASDSDSGATFNFVVAGVSASYGVITSYRGAEVVGSPIGASSVSVNASSATITWATITPYNANSLIVAVAAYNGTGTAAGAMAGTNPTMSSNELDNDAVNATQALVEYDGLSSNGAAVGARSEATGAGAGLNIGVMFEILAPPGEGPGLGFGGGSVLYPALNRGTFGSRTRSMDLGRYAGFPRYPKNSF